MTFAAVPLLPWMLYALAVGCLVAAAAWCLDRGLARAGLPTRWVWLGALALSVALPASALFSGQGGQPPPGEGAVGLEGATVVEASASAEASGRPAILAPILRSPAAALDRAGSLVAGVVGRTAAALPSGPAVERWLAVVWIAGGGTVAGILLLSGVLAARRRSRWPRARLQNRTVRISPDLGPAVMGLLPPEIVVPRWALALSPGELELVIAHEAEHLRARDPLLLTAGLVPLLLLPWHPVVWWQLRRLRDAVEMDCDRRVLRGRAAPGPYASLLLRLGSRSRSDLLFPAPALAGSSSLLERRLDAMKNRSPKTTIPLALVAAIAAISLLTLACEADAPTEQTEEEAVDTPTVEITEPEPTPTELPPLPDDVEALAEEPVFTPYEVRPELLNQRDVLRALEAGYPEDLREADISGRVVLHLFLDERGVVRRAVVSESSGHPSMDSAGQAVGMEMRFSPALNRNERVPVWIEQPITFTTRRTTSDAEARTDRAEDPAAPGARTADDPETRTPDERTTRTPDDLPPPPSDAGTLAQEPVFTPFETRPELRNPRDVMAALEDEYPAQLKDAAIGGRVVAHLFIDESGEVGNVAISTSSGHPALDRAAELVAYGMEFEPARNRGEAVPVWIEQPITFSPRPPETRSDPDASQSAASQGAASQSAASERFLVVDGVLLRGPGGGPPARADGNRPLFVVDGVVMGSSFTGSTEQIDALDVAHIEVIRGATAASMYGARAANGVVSITTKR